MKKNKERLDTVFGMIFIGFIVWILLSAIFGYADWLHSNQPSEWEFEQGAGEEYRP